VISCGASVRAIVHSRRRLGCVARPLNLDVRFARESVPDFGSALRSGKICS